MQKNDKIKQWNWKEELCFVIGISYIIAWSFYSVSVFVFLLIPFLCGLFSGKHGVRNYISLRKEADVSTVTDVLYPPATMRMATVDYDRARGVGCLYSGPQRRVEDSKRIVNKSFRVNYMITGSIFILSGIVGLYYCLKELFLLNSVDLSQSIARFLTWIK